MRRCFVPWLSEPPTVVTNCLGLSSDESSVMQVWMKLELPEPCVP
jgi:hypothetical protein